MVSTIIAGNSAYTAALQQVVSTSECAADVVSDTTQAVHALREHKTPVLLLSQQFDNKDALEQISLFKQVNKRVKIILLADTDSISYLRKARSAGIFYHVLEPRTEEDLEELGMALKAARDAILKQQSGILGRIAKVVPTLG